MYLKRSRMARWSLGGFLEGKLEEPVSPVSSFCKNFKLAVLIRSTNEWSPRVAQERMCSIFKLNSLKYSWVISNKNIPYNWTVLENCPPLERLSSQPKLSQTHLMKPTYMILREGYVRLDSQIELIIDMLISRLKVCRLNAKPKSVTDFSIIEIEVSPK